MDSESQLDFTCLLEFPNLVVPDYHILFKEKICYFYFNLFRKHSKHVLELSKQLSDVLGLLKKCIQKSQDEYLPYLTLFYRMLGQTRDILYGKGEHDISYMMLLQFYEVYPTLAIYALYRFVKPTNSIDVPYGSWRDIKYLCSYIREHSKKADKHELIQICIELMNSQLEKDFETWQFSIHARSQKHISNVAKWIPREHKQFDWLYSMLSLHWAKLHNPVIFETLTKPDSIIKANLKTKRMYRKRISFLNKALDTTEIKQCSQKIDDIEPKRVAWHTLMKQPKLVFGSDEIHSTFSQKMRDYMMFPSKNGEHYSNYYPIAFFVKTALTLIGSPNDEKKIENDLLNSLWSKFSNTFSKEGFSNVLPILDASFFSQAMDSDAYYFGIGYAFLIAERSNFEKRILVVDYQATWINIEESSGFVSIIENIHNTLVSRTNTVFNIENAMQMVVYSLIQSKSTRRFIENINIVIFSDFKFASSIYTLKNIFIDQGILSPNIIYWNLSKYELIEPCYNVNDNIVLVSGISNGAFSALRKILKNLKLGKKGIFENVSAILNDSRYDVLGSYLKYVVSV
jgi:hypothetical protein